MGQILVILLGNWLMWTAPEIYFHRWQPLVGFGPFDPVPAEIARRQAAMPSCKAP